MTNFNNDEYNEILNILWKNYGYDFKDYAPASLKRRIAKFLVAENLTKIFDVKFKLINDRAFSKRFLNALTVNVTEMFRDAEFFLALRTLVIPRLASYPNIKIWHAGCSTGEEVYSMAILLEEAGLLERTQIYATDLNPLNIEKAKQGIYSPEEMKLFIANYHESGGDKEFSNYYVSNYERCIMLQKFKERIVFNTHNLVSESSFNEFQLIICRNVLIYFNKILQNKVLNLFLNSLIPRGFLAIGTKESILFSESQHAFELIAPRAKIYKRR